MYARVIGDIESRQVCAYDEIIHLSRLWLGSRELTRRDDHTHTHTIHLSRLRLC